MCEKIFCYPLKININLFKEISKLMNMFFGKKEEKAGLPDLPPLPNLPSKDDGLVGRRSAFPEFPDSPEKSRASDGMRAMTQRPRTEDSFAGGLSADSKKVKVVEMEEWHPQNPQYGEPPPFTPEYPGLREEDGGSSESESLPEPKEMYVHKKPAGPNLSAQQQSDVFVRIDKFRTAKKSLGEIQNRLDDIDELIKRIRDTKLKEEQELANWEKDLMQVKSRIHTVTENIFEKVE